MTLDPSAQRLLDLIQQSGAIPINEAPDLNAARTASTLRARAVALDPPEGIEAQDFVVPGDPPCPVRVYRPAGTAGTTLPVVLFMHGGGWVLGSLDSHDHVCRHLAHGAGCAVVSVDYRLAPEHPFPAAVDDVMAVYRWLAQQGGALAIDTGRIALCGDSAGGNLAAVASLLAPDQGLPMPRLQVLLYPACDLADQSDSYLRNGTGYILPRAAMAFFVNSYIPDQARRHDWRASPLRSAELPRSPATIIYTAEYDILRDEGYAFAEALRKAHVQVELREVRGHMHGFATFGKLLPVAATVLAEIAADLAKGFSENTPGARIAPH